MSMKVFSRAMFLGPAISVDVTVRTALALIITKALTKFFPTGGTIDVEPVRTLETS